MKDVFITNDLNVQLPSAGFPASLIIRNTRKMEGATTAMDVLETLRNTNVTMALVFTKYHHIIGGSFSLHKDKRKGE